MTVTIVVLDSVGVGELPDAANFGDAGAHTLDHALTAAPVALPNLQALGLGNVPGVTTLPAALHPQASYGRLAERSLGKDTTTGHWEFMGIVLEHPFQTFSRFPDVVMNAFDAATGRGHLGNVVASGTTIIETLGARHLETGPHRGESGVPDCSRARRWCVASLGRRVESGGFRQVPAAARGDVWKVSCSLAS